MGIVAVRDGQLKHLESVRCQACGRLLFRMDADALKASKVVEVKCKCDAMNYQFGRTTS